MPRQDAQQPLAVGNKTIGGRTFAIVTAAHEQSSDFASMSKISGNLSVRSSAGGFMRRMEHGIFRPESRKAEFGWNE